MNTFSTFDLKPELIHAIEKLGYEEATDIQAKAIPSLLDGNDVLGRAQTGTGKTAAFALPILQMLDVNSKHVQALVMAPTRELANQVAQAVREYGQFLNVKVLTVYGGQSYTPQLKSLREGVQVVVGTPGRLLDLSNKKKALDLSHVKYLVLDEADEMLAMGFIEEVGEILDQTPSSRQTAFFSATLPKSIRGLAGKHLRQPVEIAIQGKQVTLEQIEQRYYMVRESDKLAALMRIFETDDVSSALLFTRTKVRAAEFAEALQNKKYPAAALHGDMKQSEREKVLGRFRKGKLSLLVATDVAARGLDIDDVSHVFNVDVPLDAESYVHRIGRTGRAGKKGTAITLATPSDHRRLRTIERYVKQPIPRAELPTVEAVQSYRDDRFIDQVVTILALEKAQDEKALVQQVMDYGYDPYEVAAAAIKMARQSEELRPIETIKAVKKFNDQKNKKEQPARQKRRNARAKMRGAKNEKGMIRLSINVGKVDNVRPGNIVGAIANTSGIPGSAIGAIDIQQKKTYLDVSEKYVESVLRGMRNWKMHKKPVMIDQCV